MSFMAAAAGMFPLSSDEAQAEIPVVTEASESAKEELDPVLSLQEEEEAKQVPALSCKGCERQKDESKIEVLSLSKPVEEETKTLDPSKEKALV